VVANEVKSLASQTARATEEITGQIASMQGIASTAVGAVSGIKDSIAKINDIAGQIAHSIREQASATQEISTNAQRAGRAHRQRQPEHPRRHRDGRGDRTRRRLAAG
jgi:methyl-accepting chemotaxis protein